jgi:hypothetical protein
MKKQLLLTLISLLLLAFGATAVSAHRGALHYTAPLSSLNDSGVSGVAHLTLDGDQLTVSIQADGFEANRVHPQHIHGFTENKANATCPTEEADANGDGVIDLGEGLPDYGPVLLSLQEFPTAPTGSVDFEATYTVDARDLGPLQNRAIVLHGLTVNGEYVPSLPIACGQIWPANSR